MMHEHLLVASDFPPRSYGGRFKVRPAPTPKCKEAMSLEAGKQLGTYKIIGPLGAGGMGEVYRATDSTLDREVALKVLPDAMAHDPDRVARFEREAKLLASLNHPHIAAIHGCGQSDDNRFLVLELVEGPTLTDRLADGPMLSEEVLDISLQIVDALDAAHSVGIVHRDIKPSNISLNERRQVKVLDFGLAKRLLGRETNDPDMRTPSPENAASRNKCSRIWKRVPSRACHWVMTLP